jgi:hypothetical protein
MKSFTGREEDCRPSESLFDESDFSSKHKQKEQINYSKKRRVEDPKSKEKESFQEEKSIEHILHQS